MKRPTWFFLKQPTLLLKVLPTIKRLKNGVSASEKQKIDSLFNHYMKAYNIEIKYSFSIKPFVPTFKNDINLPNNLKMNQSGCYQTCVTESSSKRTRNNF